MTESPRYYAEQVLAAVSQPILVMTGDLEVEKVNEAFCHTFEIAPQEAEGRRIYDLGNGQWDIPELRRLLQEVLTKDCAVTDYEVVHDFERVGTRTMGVNARRMARGRADDRIVLAIDDITKTERLKYELEGRMEFAEKLVDSIREGLLILHWNLTVHSANQAFYDHFRVSPEETVGKKIYDLGSGEWDIPELRTLLEQVLPDDNAFDDFLVEHEFRQIGLRIMLVNGRRLDHLDLIILAIRDVTEQKDQERRQQTFMGELQHRVKNILNNVRSLANQTIRQSESLEQFRAAFLPRLDALARAQSLLIESPDEDVELADILRVELEAVGAQEGGDYTSTGPSIRLAPRDAQVVAMAVHELATNAGKYGALKEKDGRITIEWWYSDDGAEICFRWRESGVRIDNTEPKRGFGSQAITRSVPHMLGGTATLSLHEDGAECLISVPVPDQAKTDDEQEP